MKMNSQAQKWNAEVAKAQVKERQDQVAAAIKSAALKTAQWLAAQAIAKAKGESA